MAEPSDERWQETGNLAATTLGIAGGIVVVGAIVAALGVSDTGFPLVHLLASWALPVGLAGLVFWFARRQQVIDRRFGHFED